MSDIDVIEVVAGDTVDVLELDPTPIIVDVTTPPAVTVVDVGNLPGPPPGPAIVAIPYASWPPADPQPDVLYLRLAP